MVKLAHDRIKELAENFGWKVLASGPKEIAPKVMTTTFSIQKPDGTVKEYTAGEILGLAHDYGWDYVELAFEDRKIPKQ